jgi:hypothetical protein
LLRKITVRAFCFLALAGKEIKPMTTPFDKVLELLQKADDKTLDDFIQFCEIKLAVQGTAIRAPRADEWAKLPEEARQKIYEAVIAELEPKE